MASPAPQPPRLALALGLILSAYFGFTMIDTSAKWLGGVGLPVMEVVLVRYGAQLVFASAIHLPRRGLGLLRSGDLKLEIVRALFLFSSTVLNFAALRYLPLTVTASISFTVPLMLCALSGPLLGEQVGWRRWSAVVVGFVGVLVIVGPGTSAFHPAVFLSLGGALMSALYFVATKRLAGVDSAATQQFYAALVATVVLAPFGLTSGWVWPARPVDWLFFVLIGAAALTGHSLFSTAMRFAPASVLAPFAYSKIVFMTASSWLIFSEPPGERIYLGAPIVIGSGLYIWVRERRLARSLKPVAPEH